MTPSNVKSVPWLTITRNSPLFATRDRTEFRGDPRLGARDSSIMGKAIYILGADHSQSHIVAIHPAPESRAFWFFDVAPVFIGEIRMTPPGSPLYEAGRVHARWRYFQEKRIVS